MSDPRWAPDDASAGRRPRGFGLAVGVLALLFVVGLLGGVVLDRYALLPRRGRVSPEAREREFNERFARALDLTPTQRTAVDSLMERQVVGFCVLRRQIRPGMDSLLASTRRSIDSVLTPTQRAKMQQLVQRGELRPPLAGGRDAGGRDPGGRDPGGRGCAAVLGAGTPTGRDSARR